MTRVTMVSYDDDPPLGGQGVVVHGMREALERRGVRVNTISGRGEHAIAVARRTGRAPLDLSLQLNRYPRILMRASPDVIHAHGGPGGVLLWKPLAVPLVYTAHHTYWQAHGRGSVKRLLAGLEARGYRRAAMVLPVSRSTANSLLEMGIPAARIEVVPNGVDVVDEPGVEHEDGRLLFVGRLEREKGVLAALEVFASLAGARSDVRGVVVGGGSLERDVRRAAASSGGRTASVGRERPSRSGRNLSSPRSRPHEQGVVISRRVLARRSQVRADRSGSNHGHWLDRCGQCERGCEGDLAGAFDPVGERGRDSAAQRSDREGRCGGALAEFAC